MADEQRVQITDAEELKFVLSLFLRPIFASDLVDIVEKEALARLQDQEKIRSRDLTAIVEENFKNLGTRRIDHANSADRLAPLPAMVLGAAAAAAGTYVMYKVVQYAMEKIDSD